MKKSLMTIAAMASCSGIIASSASSCRHYPDAFAPSRGLNAENDGAGEGGGGTVDDGTNAQQQQGVTTGEHQHEQGDAGKLAQAGADDDAGAGEQQDQAGGTVAQAGVDGTTASAEQQS